MIPFPPVLLSALAGCVSMAILLQSVPASAADLPLFKTGASLDTHQVETYDAKISLPAEGFLFHMSTGHSEKWPGVRILAPEGHWDLSASHQLALRVRNTGTTDAMIACRVDNAGADGIKHCVTSATFLAPGVTKTLYVALDRRMDPLGGKLFGMKGYPIGAAGDMGIDPAAVTSVIVFLKTPTAHHEIEVGSIRGTGERTENIPNVADATPFFPFVDTFGQYKHRYWPGKTASEADLRARRDAEAKELAQAKRPQEWNQFGGWEAGPQLSATGFFRTEQRDGKWWLVDPEGRLFFSQGIDCVRLTNATAVDERETWFEDFPGNKPEFEKFFTTGTGLHGHYAKRTAKCFSFSGANLLRKYGADWEEKTRELAHQRLHSWGFNTIGNWSDETIRLKRQTPYVDTLDTGKAKRIEGSEGYWIKFPDVFDPAFKPLMTGLMEAKKGKTAGDPWCLGFFTDNEMSWGDSLSLALAALQSPAGQPAKAEFIADLKSKYGQINGLNQVWGTDYASWEALTQSRTAPDKAKARKDLAAFYLKTARTYFRTMRDIIKAVTPHQLYIGCRFAGVNELSAKAANEYCDMVSYNIYQRQIADSQILPGNKPVLIGEFHFGALDRGMFHPGLVPVANQKERAEAYKEYMLEAARNPQVVGAHWFLYLDEPLTGRILDEENYQIGFVDIADTPYVEMIKASREVAAEMYRVRAGQ